MNTLYGTEVVAMPDGSSFDISHIMCQLDLAINGRGAAGGVSSVGANTNGVLTWTGDLGSGFQAWLRGNPHPRQKNKLGFVRRDADTALEQPRLDFLASKNDARASICNEIQNAVSVLMTDLAWPADGFPEILWAITDEFIAFLQKGLETGVADW